MARSNSHQNMSISKDSQITDRRKALRRKGDEEIRRSEERFRTITENSFDGVSIIGADGTILYESPSVKWMLGYEVEDRIGANAFEDIHPDDMLEAANAFQKIVNNPDETVTIILRIKHEDGSWRWIECSGRNLINNASVGGIVINYHDITDRKLMEDALRKSDELYHLITDNITDVIWTTDMNLKFTYTSPSVTRLRGYSVEEAMSLSLKETLTPSSFELAMKVYEEEMAIEKREQKDLNRSRCIQVEEYCKDGSTIWIDVEMTFIQDSEGKAIGILGIARDITERKQAEEALCQSEEKYHAIFEEAGDGIALIDAETGDICDCNPEFERQTGRKLEQLKKMRVWEIRPPEKVEAAREKFLEVRGKGVGGSSELDFQKPDGEIVTVEFKAKVVESGGRRYMQSIVRDITERQRMEESLRLKEDAIEYSLGAIAMSDMEGKITYVNKACMRLWGSDNKEDIVGKPYWELLESLEAVPEKAIKRMQEIKEIVTEDHFWNGELAGINKEGKKIHLYVTSSIVKDNDGNPIQTISSFYDVTERKQAEEEKERMEQQLQVAGRLAAVGELSAGIAHELNNPLAAVQAFAQFLSERKDLDESTKSDVETIYRESQRATRITTNLLSFARKHKPEKGLISINEALEKSLELHAYRMGVNSIEISMELDQELPRTMADFHQLEQVFVNIITNAEQAMTEAHGGGKLLVKTQMVGELIQITFTDDGPGIPKDNLKSIFDPFFTTKEVGEGTGLGLSICYGIVHEHGGQIRAESEVRGGAAFIVELPIVYED